MKSNNHGSSFRMDAYSGKKQEEGKKVEGTFAYDAMMGSGKKAETPAEESAPVSAKGESPVSGDNAGSNFRMDAYAGKKKDSPKVESTFAYDAMMGSGKKAETPAEESAPVSAKGESPVSGDNAGSNFRMDAYAGKKKDGPKVESTFAYDTILGKK